MGAAGGGGFQKLLSIRKETITKTYKSVEEESINFPIGLNVFGW